jgi:hypothetical protein
MSKHNRDRRGNRGRRPNGGGLNKDDCDLVLRQSRGHINALYVQGCRETGDSDLIIIVRCADSVTWRYLAAGIGNPEREAEYLGYAAAAAAEGPGAWKPAGSWVRREDFLRHLPDERVRSAVDGPAAVGQFYVYVELDHHDPGSGETGRVTGIALLPVLEAAPETGYIDEALAKFKQALEDGTFKPGFVHTIDVYHDDHCALLAGTGPCDCVPDVRPPRKLEPPEGGPS